MIDFLRSAHGTIAAYVFAGLGLYILSWMTIGWLSQQDDPEIKTLILKVKACRNILLVVTGAMFVVVLFTMAVVNETPRATLDRTSVNKQADDYEKHVEEVDTKEKK